MPQAESYVVRGQVPAVGVLVSDFSFLVDGAIRPALLKTGDIIDLEHVEIEGFARSSRLGVLSGMEEGGTLVRVMVEVSEKTFDALRVALLNYPHPVTPGRYAHATEVISLEPGLQVAVGGMPQPTLPTVAAAPAVELPKTVQTAAAINTPEPGLQVGQTPAEVPPVVEEAPEPEPSWKDGKTLGEQEQFLKESTETEFLTQVAEDPEETKKLRRLAKSRLKELES